MFDQQIKKLEIITKEQCNELYEMYNRGKNDASLQKFQAFQEKLYESKLIFNFNWIRWYDGYDSLEDTKSDYSQLPIIKVSMLLTSIFQSEMFCQGTIEKHLQNETIQKLMERLIKLKEG